jgi:PRTRC genetic system protein A
MAQNLIEYNLSRANADHQARGQLYDYMLAGNGVFIRAEREYLAATIPIAPCDVRGLPAVERNIATAFRRVPSELVERINASALGWAIEHKECVWHLLWSPVFPYYNGWQLIEPHQSRSYANCRPLVDGPSSSHEKALIEIHSHHVMPAKFSPQDDKDETGFRLYGVIGNFGRNRPVCRMRLGVYGYFAPVAASSVLECEGIWEDA